MMNEGPTRLYCGGKSNIRLVKCTKRYVTAIDYQGPEVHINITDQKNDHQ